MSLKGAFWREAATVILAGKCLPNTTASTAQPSIEADYKVLMLKRSQKSKFMPETMVFPGGVLSDEDFSTKWDDLFKSVLGKSIASFSSYFTSRKSQPPAFTLKRPESALPAEIAFRICAIRETFEESGILLLTKSIDGQGLVPSATSKSLNLTDWRRRVNKDAGQFLQLCQDLKAVPNLWAMKEWSNWLTPVMQQVKEPPAKPRRFDTIFFICCLADLPEARVDRRETTVAQWVNPSGIIKSHLKGELEMIGPQLYELSRLCNFSQVADLNAFSRARAPEGVERWMPVMVVCDDGFMTVLPGDDLYPDQPDYDHGQIITRSESREQLLKLCPNWNRMPRSKGYDGRKINVNIEHACGHISPHVSFMVDAKAKI